MIMIAAELVTISFLLVSLYVGIKHYDKIDEFMNKIIK